MFVQIALPIPKRTLFTYALPEALEDLCRPGCLALVPVGRGNQVGLVWKLSEESEWSGGGIRQIIDILGEEPLFSDEMIHLLDWISRYYLRPIGSVVAAAMPGHLRFERRRRAIWLGEEGLERLARLEEGSLAEQSDSLSENKSLPSKKKKPDPARQAELIEPLPPSLKPLAEALAKRPSGLTEETLARRFGRKGLDAKLKGLVKRGLIELEEDWRPRQGASKGSAKGSSSGQTLASSGAGGEGVDGGDLSEPFLTCAPELTSEQRVCAEALEGALEGGEFAPFLLRGVTGSGKTEVYFRAVEQCLNGGRQALLLVPEIALTPQLTRRYRARFGDDLALFHSGLSDGLRLQQWHQLRRGKARVALGARSALFAPFSNLGLVVVDEEHDGAYKQEDGVPYHGRDMAVVRAKNCRATLILGSATPSMESLANARLGRYTLLELNHRATGAKLPRVELVNLKEAAQKKERPWNALVSEPLRCAMVETLASDRQVLLFLNRRGFAPALVCRRCGAAVNCENCSVTLTLHMSRSRLMCHYCGLSKGVDDVCVACGQLSMATFGPGTEQVESEVRELFPEARVIRLDRDTVGKGGVGLEETLELFRLGEMDVLVGTQMAAKGHHFPKLALVGVVLAETGLWMPDFRAAERTFQTVTQVAGRAGREEGDPGRVLVQTLDPGHYALGAAMNHDIGAFADTELSFRSQAGYPPGFRLAMIRFSALDPGLLADFCQALGERLPHDCGVELLGPAPAPLFKLRRRFRWQLLFKERERGRLHGVLAGVLALGEEMAMGRIRLDADVDPYSFL
ncbi:MAG: primosomal protein N' [Magnetococcales bacterium]|nr:primosomal protein N' [Magnetococcales bacterium]